MRYPKVRFAVSFAFPPSISDAEALPSEQPADVELAIDLVWARRTISEGAIVGEILATQPHVAVLSCDQDAIVKKKWDAKLNNEPSNFCRREETSPGVFEERCLRFSAELLATDCGFSMARQTFQTANGQVQASVGGRISKGNRGFVLRVDEIAL